MICTKPPAMAEAIQSNWWALVGVGLFVGAFAGLFGLGGGAVIVPLLVLLLKKKLNSM